MYRQIVTISNYICEIGFSTRIGKKCYFKIFGTFLDLGGRGGYSETTINTYLFYFSVVLFFTVTHVYQCVVLSVLISNYIFL